MEKNDKKMLMLISLYIDNDYHLYYNKVVIFHDDQEGINGEAIVRIGRPSVRVDYGRMRFGSRKQGSFGESDGSDG
ncbi:hypothetical protein RB620_21360 [Paenibacillus sp. LHD-117]|uniref:hypothetical protein n=1 Tax=Paenibacillus sp. LHD-117 TaxID=3071412 RepID=UPI0027E161B6|nr:hypothetical protein [Paenibacillus sp. LHD-117]MDQ6421982.1 hypothetical protein [Paenibacillus sp. LHD-117]